MNNKNNNTSVQPSQFYSTEKTFLYKAGRSQRQYFFQKLGAVGVLNQTLASGVMDFLSHVDDLNNKESVLTKQQALKDLVLTGSYSGNRHIRNLPVRGQRTHTNAKTRRKRKIV